MRSQAVALSFCFNDTATTEIYTLSLHDALPILLAGSLSRSFSAPSHAASTFWRHCSSLKIGKPSSRESNSADRKSTRLNSSHANISYAVFCLKKKNQRLTSHEALIPYTRSAFNK